MPPVKNKENQMKWDEETGQPALRSGIDYINPGQDEQAEVYGYCRSQLNTAITWFFIICTGGLLRLVFHWKPEWMLLATHQMCSLSLASKVLVVAHYKKYRRSFVKNIYTINANQISYDREYSVLRSGTGRAGAAESNVDDSVEESGSGSGEGGEGGQPMANLNTPTMLSVPKQSGQILDVPSVRVFHCKKILYIWDEDEGLFYRLPGQDTSQTGESLHQFRGMSWSEQMRKRLIYGENAIHVPITPIYRLLFLEALNPFYIFQIFSVILWFSDDYIYYASVIVITSLVSLVTEVYQMHVNEVGLSSTIQTSDIVEVLREGEVSETIPSEHLVPGDVLVVPPQGCYMQCDAVLLHGNCIVNESMLTGESVPVTKIPIPNDSKVHYSVKEHSRHTLYCGTQVIQTRYYGGERVLAVVVRTGFLTSKGSLVRSIMYPPPVDFKFQQDSYKFVGVLAGIASIGFIYTVVSKYLRNVSAADIALDSFDLITIVIPPALPMAMTVGILYALQRLKSHKIFCISPRSINISGVLNCVCFDKTGTLTEDGLDMRGVVPVKEAEGDKLCLGAMVDAKTLPNCNFIYAMASCHSITIINMQMVGDPLDLIMFESTGWVLDEPGLDDTNKYDMMMPTVVRPEAPDIVTSNENVEIEPPLEIGILRQFPFSSSLQRMSVITRRLGGAKFELFCKGSPEMVASLSKPETLPSNFSEILLQYTHQGYRVLALAWKPLKLSYLKAQRISREDVEIDLEFLGLLVLENRLKTETTPIIRQLTQAKIRTIMVTGDNMLTALSVGRECGLVERFHVVISVKASPPQPGEKLPQVTFHPTTAADADTNTTPQDNSVSLKIDADESSRYRFAIEGKSWAVIHTHYPDLLQRLVVRGSIFARMNPDQKQQLIQELQGCGYFVGMCGDGANDCGALKAAHAGISLSEAEASVASPFTSREPNISCVPILIREGRTALVTSFGVFKFMAAYSLTQFVSIMILYSIESNLTDIQFLWVDLFLITVFAVFFGRTDSFKGPLAAYSPPAALLSLAPIMSIIIHMAVIISFQTFAFFYVQEQSWYVPFNVTTNDDILAGHENYAVFSISQFQYIILALVFSRGPPFRKPVYTNYWLIGSIIVTTAFSIMITIAPPAVVIEWFELVMPPPDNPQANFFRWQILIFAALNSAISVFVEYVLVDYLLYQKCRKRMHNVEKSKKKYLVIERDLLKDKSWPKLSLGDEDHSSSVAKMELTLDAKKLINESENKVEANGHIGNHSQPPLNKTTITQFHSSL